MYSVEFWFSFIFLTIICIASFLKPKLAVYLLIIVIPFHFFLTNLIIHQFNIPERLHRVVHAWKDFVLFASFSGVLLEWSLKKYRHNKRWIVDNRPIILFILTGLLAFPLSGNIVASVEGFRTIFEYVFLYLLTVSLIRKPQEVRKMIHIILIIGTVVAIYGIYQYFFGMSSYILLLGESATEYSMLFYGGQMRIASTAASPNGLGFYLMMTILLSFGIYRRDISKPYKIEIIFSTVIMFICLLFTQSRASWVGGAIGLFVFVIIGKNKKLLIYIPIMLIAGLILSPPAIRMRANSIVDLNDPFTSVRLFLWKDNLSRFMSRPMGYGIGTMGHLGNRYRSGFESIVDNNYLKILLEMGLQGLIAFVWLLYSLFKKGIRSHRDFANQHLSYIPACLLSSLAAFAITGLFANAWEILPGGAYFWILAGFLMAFANTKLPSNVVKIREVHNA